MNGARSGSTGARPGMPARPSASAIVTKASAAAADVARALDVLRAKREARAVAAHTKPPTVDPPLLPPPTRTNASVVASTAASPPTLPRHAYTPDRVLREVQPVDDDIFPHEAAYLKRPSWTAVTAVPHRHVRLSIAHPSACRLSIPPSAALDSTRGSAQRSVHAEFRVFRLECAAMLKSHAAALADASARILRAFADFNAKHAQDRDRAKEAAARLESQSLELEASRQREAELQLELQREREDAAAAQGIIATLKGQVLTLKDSIAEARGTIRIVASLRPMLATDLHTASAVAVGLAHGVKRLISAASAHSPALGQAVASAVHSWMRVALPLHAWQASLTDVTRGSAARSDYVGSEDIAPVCIPTRPSITGDGQALLLCPSVTVDDVLRAVAGCDATAVTRALQHMLRGKLASSGSMFTFDRCLHADAAGRRTVFEEVRPMLDAVFRGKNACICAYGATGSGKSYTMGTAAHDAAAVDDASHASDAYAHELEGGLIVSAIAHMHARARDATSAQRLFLTLSVVEVYNDSTADILARAHVEKVPFYSDTAPVAPAPAKRSLSRPRNAPTAPSAPSTDAPSDTHACVEVLLDTPRAAALAVMSAVARVRVTSATALNARSSRSHCVYRVRLRSDASDVGSRSRVLATAMFADLAGAERVRESRAAAAGFAEAVHVNSSLAALSDVISALIKSSAHVPYRNSELTRLLQPCLAPPARVLFLVHASPLPAQREQTAATLKFAAKMACTPVARVNVKGDVVAAIDECVQTPPPVDLSSTSQSLVLRRSIATPPTAGGKTRRAQREAAQPAAVTTTSSSSSSMVLERDIFED